jgi:hypothetical protein
MESWNHGIMESWNHGIMESWNHGIMESWNHGIMESWNHGIMECIIISTIFIRIIIIDERQTCSRSRYYSSITVCHF